MENLRRNTVSLDFTVLKERLTALETHLFIKGKLNIELQDIDAIEIIYSRVFIKLKTAELVASLLEKFASGYVPYIQGDTEFQVPLANEDNNTLIKVFHVPIAVPNEHICSALAPYGKIKSIKNEVWGNHMPFPGIPTGVRLVNMNLAKPIPSFIICLGRRTLVTYPGQIKTCKICSSVEHFSDTCPKSLRRRLEVDPTSYSSALLSPPSIVNERSKVNKQASIIDNSVTVTHAFSKLIDLEKDLQGTSEAVDTESAWRGDIPVAATNLATSELLSQPESSLDKDIQSDMEKHRSNVYIRSKIHNSKKRPINKDISSTSEDDEDKLKQSDRKRVSFCREEGSDEGQIKEQNSEGLGHEEEDMTF